MKIWRRVRRIVSARRFEAELAEEVRFHREMAGKVFGSVALTMEDSRAVWGFAWFTSLIQDIRYALRGFGKSPEFALTVIGTLALGMGVLAVAFSFFNALFLRPIAVRDPFSLYSFRWTSRDYVHAPSTWREFTDLRAQKTAFSDVLAHLDGVASIAGRTVEVQAVSGNYFAMLGGRACLGRALGNGDDQPGTAVAVASYEYWKGRLNSDPASIGRKLYLRGQPLTLVGVACPEFGGLSALNGVWVSLPLASALVNGPDLYGPEQPAALNLVGRLKPGITRQGAEAALLAYGRQISGRWRGGKRPERVAMRSEATLEPLEGQMLLTMAPVFVLFGLVLLIACANASNMTLARALARQREIGVRLSLGAGRGRVVRQFLTESLLLALAAAPAAFGIASATVYLVCTLLMRDLASGPVPYALYSPDWRVLAFLLAVAAISTLAFGVVPATQATRTSLSQAIRGEFGNDRRPARLRNALVTLQVTVCVLLVVLAGAALRSVRIAALQDTGMDVRGVFGIHLPPRFRAPMAAQLRAEPLLESLGVADGWIGTAGMLRAEGRSGTRLLIWYDLASPEYFRILRIPLLRGRNFSEAEADAENGVVIVSETAARRLWPGEDAIGQTLKPLPLNASERGPALVVGIVRDVHVGAPRSDASLLYYPAGPGSKRDVDLLVRMRGESGDARRAIDAAAGRVGHDVADMITSGEGLMNQRLSTSRTLFGITGILGALALLLTASGIYGVLSYLVSRRRKEFGIRIALGAGGGDVTWMVFRQSMRLVALGSAIGFLLALAIGRVIAAAEQGMIPFDLGGCAAGVAVVVAAAMAASWIPARRAVKVDPAVTLRCD